MTPTHPSPSTGFDLRIMFMIPLRQFTWWLIMVLLISFVGYPGVVCITPMAWLLALRVGNLVTQRSQSEQRSRRLIEAALAGGLLGLLQGILFAAIVPLMHPIQDNEVTNSIIFILGMLLFGTLAAAGLAFFTAFLNENRRESSQ